LWYAKSEMRISGPPFETNHLKQIYGNAITRIQSESLGSTRPLSAQFVSFQMRSKATIDLTLWAESGELQNGPCKIDYMTYFEINIHFNISISQTLKVTINIFIYTSVFEQPRIFTFNSQVSGF